MTETLINRTLRYADRRSSSFFVAAGRSWLKLGFGTLYTEVIAVSKQTLPDNIEAIFPLSPTQQGMLYHSLHTPDSGMYLGQHCLELVDVDDTLLQQAWTAVVARHASLRTLFAWRGLSKSVQLVLTSAPSDFGRHTLAETDLAAWLAADAAQDFDFAQTPPSRVNLITPLAQPTDGGTRVWFVWTRHHLIVDGWSAQTVLAELQAAYTALVRHEPWQPRVAPSFATYIGWLQKAPTQASLQHWHTTLAPLTDRTRTSELSALKTPILGEAGTRRIEAQLSAAITATLEACRKPHGLTLSTLVHGAWAAVLARDAQDTPLVFGSTISGRPTDLPDHDRIVGSFINTIPIVAELTSRSTGYSLAAWLHDLQSQILSGSQHGHISKRDMLSATGLPSWSTLFSSIVVYMNYPQAATDAGELRINQSRYDEHSHYALALLVVPGDQLTLIMIHDRSEIDDQTADLLLAQVKQRISAMSTALSHTFADYLLADTGSPQNLPSVALVEPIVDVVSCLRRTVHENPTRTALRDAEHHLTYSELGSLTQSLAGRLQAMGVGKGASVLIAMPRTIDALVAIWSILSLRAAYVPVSPDSPVARLNAIASACDAILVIAPQAIAGLEPTCLELPADPAGATGTGTSSREVTDFLARGKPNEADTAYRIHTSGSTGTAKSIAITHRQLSHSLAARIQFYGRKRYRFALFSPLAFDSSVASIFWMAATGGELVLVPEAVVQNPITTATYLLEQKVDAFLTLPSVYDALLACAPPALLQNLRLVIVAGEACPAGLLQTHNAHCPNAALVNEYGPTEATVWAVAKRHEPKSTAAYQSATLAIGQAIPGCQLRVINAAGDLCSPGAIGELVVYGPTVELSHRQDGGYATGDLVQALPDGDLVFRGRRDQQIKIRGHRFEASEVEATLLGYPSIESCAVVLQQVSLAADIDALDHALNQLTTAQALALLEEVEVMGA